MHLRSNEIREKRVKRDIIIIIRTIFQTDLKYLKIFQTDAIVAIKFAINREEL